MDHNYWACALEPRNHTTKESVLGTRSPEQEKSLQWEAHTPQLESSPNSLQPEKAGTATKTQNSQKQMNKIKNKKKNQRKAGISKSIKWPWNHYTYHIHVFLVESRP